MTPELRDLLIAVISSWQVIAVTIALVIYFSLVSRVSRLSSIGVRRNSSSKTKSAKKKKAPVAVPAPSDSDDLGVEIEQQ